MAGWLPACLDGALSPRRARAVADHLSVCPRCRQEQRSLEAAIHALDRVGRETPTIDLWDAFSHRLTAERSASRADTGLRVIYLQRALSGIAAGAVAVAACLWNLTVTRPEPLMQPQSPPLSAAVTKPESATLDDSVDPERTGTLPEVRSPEQIMALRPSEPAQASLSSWQVTRPVEQSRHPAEEPAPDPRPAVAVPSEDLLSIVDALMVAQQNTAREQVAREMLILAEGIVRHNGQTAIIHPEDPS